MNAARTTISVMERLKKNLLPLLFACLIAGSLAADLAWIADDHALIGSDVPNHLTFSVDYYYRLSDILGSGDASLPAKAFRAARSVFEPLPHQGKRFSNILYLATYPFYAAGGQDLFSARLSSFAWLLPLLLAMYLLGKELHSRAAGITAAGMIALHPAVFSSACQYGLDLPLTAVTALCLLLLLKCRDFSDYRYSLLLGAALGIGLFIKFYIFLFVGAPFAYVMARAFMRGTTRTRLLNMGMLFFLVALALYAWWGEGQKDILSPNNDPLSFYDLLRLCIAYFHNLTVFVLGPLLAVLAASGAYLLARSKREDRYFHVLGLLAPAAVFLVLYCMLPDWHERWLMPVLPAGAAIAAWGIHQVKNTRARNGILLAVMAVLSVTFYRVTFQNDISWRPAHYNLRIDPVFHTSPALFQKHMYKNDRYGIRELASGITESAPARRTRILAVLLGPQAEQVVETFELTYWMRSHDRNLEVCDLFMMFDEAYTSLDSFDYVLLQLPYNAAYGGWPPYDEFVRLAKTVPDGYTILRLSKSAVAGDLFRGLYDRLPRYTLVKKVRTPFKYDWYLYRKAGDTRV